MATLTKTGKILYTTLSWIRFILLWGLVAMIVIHLQGNQTQTLEATIGIGGVAYGVLSLICFTWFEIPTRIDSWEARLWRY